MSNHEATIQRAVDQMHASNLPATRVRNGKRIALAAQSQPLATKAPAPPKKPRKAAKPPAASAPKPKPSSTPSVKSKKPGTPHVDQPQAPEIPGNLIRFTHKDSSATCTIHVGDCREAIPLATKSLKRQVDLIFADPPFNWSRGYDHWNDALPEDQYLRFTYDWLDACISALRPGGALWVNIPDDWAAEIVCYLKRGMPDPVDHAKFRTPPVRMLLPNWCVWHYRFGQNTTERFINSKVHALYFLKPASGNFTHTWNPLEVLELSDRAAIYGDPRTLSKRDGMPPGKRVPMDVWYGKFWGRVQGNSKERRHYHDNQLPEVYLERVVRACSNPGDTVLDPFLGSGTTGVIAHALARNFIGTEFSPINAQHAADRIRRGPIRIGAAQNQSSAIFESRASRTRTGAQGLQS